MKRTLMVACVLLSAMGASQVEAAGNGGRKATSVRQGVAAKPHIVGVKRPGAAKAARRAVGAAYASREAGISCVPYARMVTGMAVSGNGGDWWYNAAGLYDRDNRPRSGSVLAFRSSGGMARGHVAVVSRVYNARHLQIDHANWGGPGIRRGSVMQGVNVVDVSEANDWTAVRVQVGYDTGSFGRTYPTFGFIHNRPAGTLLRAEAGGRVLSEIAEDPSPRR